MEMPKVWVTQEEITKVRREMALFRDMFNHLKTVVVDLKHTITVQNQEKIRNSASVSTDSGMSSETPPNQHVAENGVDCNKKSDEVEKDNAAQALLCLQTSAPIRPVQPLRYGLIRHNPTREPRKNIKQEPKSPLRSVKAEVDTVHATPEAYLHKKKRAVMLLEMPSNLDAISTNMVPIGSGKTLVPREAYSKINWNSYTIATRKLLIAVFPRKVLATHSMTGKASPAFANKPAKLCLDQRKVADVVITVSEKCKVKESLVRNAITTKCADENKMLRMKEKRNKTT